MVWRGYRAMGKAATGGANAFARAGESIATAAILRGGGRGARRGYLAPGDPPPPPTATTDYLDYRGAATWQEASNLQELEFPIGTLMDLRRGRFHGQLTLPASLLNRHAVCVGPAGSGKTAGLLIPWTYAALACGWSVVSIDVKGNLREDFLAYKDMIAGPNLGAKLIKWDFTTPNRSIAWEWITELHDDARMDAAITALLGRKPERSATDPFYYQRDYRTLRGLLSFVRALEPQLRTAGELIRYLEDDNALTQMVSTNARAPGASDLEAVLRYPAADYQKVISGVVTALSALDTKGVDAVTRAPSSNRSLNLEAALDGHNMLIVGAPLRGGQVSATLSSMLLTQLMQRLYERFGKSRRPVLLVIDEAPQITDRVDIAQLMEVARSAGVGVVVALQDLAKLSNESDRSSIVTNAATFVMLPGASPASVKDFGNRLGQRFERTFGLSQGGMQSRTPQRMYGTEAVPVLREREIMQPPFGQRPAVIHLKAQEMGITPKPLIVDLFRST